MDYKARLLFEYKELVEKREVLQRTIDPDVPQQFDEEQYKLLQQQLDAMMRYEEILFERIINLMK